MAAELSQIYRNEPDQSRTLIYPRTIASNVYITPSITLQDYISANVNLTDLEENLKKVSEYTLSSSGSGTSVDPLKINLKSRTDISVTAIQTGEVQIVAGDGINITSSVDRTISTPNGDEVTVNKFVISSNNTGGGDVNISNFVGWDMQNLTDADCASGLVPAPYLNLTSGDMNDTASDMFSNVALLTNVSGMEWFSFSDVASTLQQYYQLEGIELGSSKPSVDSFMPVHLNLSSNDSATISWYSSFNINTGLPGKIGYTYKSASFTSLDTASVAVDINLATSGTPEIVSLQNLMNENLSTIDFCSFTSTDIPYRPKTLITNEVVNNSVLYEVFLNCIVEITPPKIANILTYYGVLDSPENYEGPWNWPAELVAEWEINIPADEPNLFVVLNAMTGTTDTNSQNVYPRVLLTGPMSLDTFKSQMLQIGGSSFTECFPVIYGSEGAFGSFTPKNSNALGLRNCKWIIYNENNTIIMRPKNVEVNYAISSDTASNNTATTPVIANDTVLTVYFSSFTASSNENYDEYQARMMWHDSYTISNHTTLNTTSSLTIDGYTINDTITIANAIETYKTYGDENDEYVNTSTIVLNFTPEFSEGMANVTVVSDIFPNITQVRVSTFMDPVPYRPKTIFKFESDSSGLLSGIINVSAPSIPDILTYYGILSNASDYSGVSDWPESFVTTWEYEISSLDAAMDKAPIILTVNGYVPFSIRNNNSVIDQKCNEYGNEYDSSWLLHMPFETESKEAYWSSNMPSNLKTDKSYLYYSNPAFIKHFEWAINQGYVSNITINTSSWGPSFFTKNANKFIIYKSGTGIIMQPQFEY